MPNILKMTILRWMNGSSLSPKRLPKQHIISRLSLLFFLLWRWELLNVKPLVTKPLFSSCHIFHILISKKRSNTNRAESDGPAAVQTRSCLMFWGGFYLFFSCLVCRYMWGEKEMLWTHYLCVHNSQWRVFQKRTSCVVWSWVQSALYCDCGHYS